METPSSFSKRYIYAILAVIIVIGAALSYNYWRNGQALVKIEQARGKTVGLELGAAVRSDAVPAALQTYRDAIASVPSMIERAPLIIAGAELAFNNGTSSAIQSIRDLKEVAASPEVRPYIRAQALLHLASWIPNTGYDASVIDEVFSGEPYKSDLAYSGASVNPGISIRHLLLRSYGVWPTFQAAIAIASAYIDGYYWETQRNSASAAAPGLLASAEEYLAHAEDLEQSATQEQTQDVSASESYRLQRANVIGKLAHFVGKPYTEQYKNTFDSLITELSAGTDLASSRMLALTRFWYAMYLYDIDQDTSGAKAQLKQAAALVGADPNFDNNYLVGRLRAMRGGSQDYLGPVSLDSLAAISPGFKALVESIR